MAGRRSTGMVAPYVIGGPIKRAAFKAFVAWLQAPELHPTDTVIVDVLSSTRDRASGP